MSSLVPGSQPRRSTRATRDAPAYVRILPNRRADARAVQEEVLLQEELTNSREVDLNDVADEVEVEEEVYPSYSGDMSTGRRVLAPAKVLLTEERLQSEPVLYAPLGRRPNRKRPIKVDNDGPPELEVQDGKLASSSVNNLRPHFQMYASAQMKKVEAGLQEMAEIAKRERMDHIQQDERQLRLQRELNVDQYVMTEGGDEETEEMESLEMMEVQRESDEEDVMSHDRHQEIHVFGEWPLYWDRPVDFQEACDIILGIRRVPAAKMCTTVPQGYRGEGTFIIDLRGFTNRHDVGLDGLGSWGKPMGRTRFFTMEDDRAVRADDGHGHLLTPSYTFKVMSKRYEHPQTTAADEGRSKFIRKIVTGNLSPERREAVAIAVLTYEWVGEPFDFTVSNTAVRPRRATDVPQCGSKSWEAASFNAPSTGLSAGVSLETPLFATGAVDFGAAASIILGGEHIEFNKVCCRVPQSYRENGTFIVDVRNLSNDSELRRDGNGVWGKPAGNSRYYKYDPATGDAVRVDRGNKLIEGADYDIQILAKRYEHPSVGGRFVRKIYTARTPSGESAIMTTTLAVITYYWKGAPEHFSAGPQRRILTKPRSDVLIEANVQEEDQPGPSGNAKRTRPNGGAEATMADEATLKTLVLRKSLENQERFAANLDRIEAFLDRFERAGDVFLDQIWAATAGQRPEAEVLIDEGVVGEQPVPEVYAQDYIVR